MQERNECVRECRVCVERVGKMGSAAQKWQAAAKTMARAMQSMRAGRIVRARVDVLATAPPPPPPLLRPRLPS